MPKGLGKSKKPRFSAQMATVQNQLKKVMDDMGAKRYEWTIESGIGVRIMFVLEVEYQTGGTSEILRRQKEYHYISDHFNNANDNLRAAQMAISMIWRIYEDYRIRASEQEATLETLLAGFRALPHEQQLLKALADPDLKQPWEILCIDRHATKDEIHNAFNAIAKTEHPDVGGNTKHFQRVIKARDDMYATID